MKNRQRELKERLKEHRGRKNCNVKFGSTVTVNDTTSTTERYAAPKDVWWKGERPMRYSAHRTMDGNSLFYSACPIL
jgi:hypothetical protein